MNIADRFLSKDPSSAVIFEVLKESIAALSNFSPKDLPMPLKQLNLMLVTRFLSKQPGALLLTRLFYYAKSTLDLSALEQPHSFLCPEIIESLTTAIYTTQIADANLTLLFRDAVKTGHQELSFRFFSALLKKPRQIAFFHKLQEYTEVHNSPYANKFIDKVLLQAAFSVCADDPLLANYDFQPLIEEDPQLFHLFVSWITSNEKGLVHAAHFQNEELRPAFVSTVLDIMKFAQEHVEFRPIASSELKKALTSCADRATLSVNNLLLEKRLFESQGMPYSTTLEICKAKIATDVLREFSARLGEQKKEGDPIEIQLYLESFFRQEFGLIGAIEEQRFEANVKPSDIRRARAAIRNVLNNPTTLSDLLLIPDEYQNDSPWVKKLKQDPTIAKEFLAIQEISYQILEAFNEDDWEKPLKKIPKKDRTLFNRLLEKHKFKGPELAKYDALKEMNSHKEQLLFQQKTLEIINACS